MEDTRILRPVSPAKRDVDTGCGGLLPLLPFWATGGLALRLRVWFEAISESARGEQMSGMAGVTLELAAKRGDVDAEVVGLTAVRGSPDLAEKGLMVDGLVGVADEYLEQVPLRRCQTDLAGRRLDPPAGQVDGEAVGDDHRLALIGTGAAQSRT
jgi:hypothetical protein